MDELCYQLWFHELPIPSESKILLLEQKITPKAYFLRSMHEYLSDCVNLLKAEQIQNSKRMERYQKIEEYIAANHIEYLSYNNSKYPDSLRNLINPPVGLFCRGKLPKLDNSLAVVGARNASDYGRSVAYQLSHQLSKSGISIVSGMARGIDSCAHKGALQGKSSTVAVMGSGFQNIYPKENLALYNEILEKGCIVTEFMPDCPPFSHNFPQRNRIISGLSKRVLVVEAGDKSGSLITVTHALDQGKDIYAIPGNIYNAKSIGTNKLIRDGAKIVLGWKDIIEDYVDVDTVADSRSKGACVDHSTDAKENDAKRMILAYIGNGAVSLETLLEESNIRTEQMLSAIGSLECEGRIRRICGNHFVSA